MIQVLVFIFIVAISACAQQPVPIAYHCPRIVLPSDPALPVKNLNANSKPNDVMKAWVATAVGLRTWNKIVRQQINASQ